MDALQYRLAAIDLIIRLTGCPREWAEETCDEETANDWHDRWSRGGAHAPLVAEYVAAALYDHGFAGDGTYYGENEYKPDWL